MQSFVARTHQARSALLCGTKRFNSSVRDKANQARVHIAASRRITTEEADRRDPAPT